jgi:hypothetical protein
MLMGWMGRGLRVALMAGVFGAGYLWGAFGAPRAEAQVAEAMKKGEKKADPQNGASGLVGQLASSINDMQQRVDGMQKDLETLKSIKAALGG